MRWKQCLGIHHFQIGSIYPLRYALVKYKYA